MASCAEPNCSNGMPWPRYICGLADFPDPFLLPAPSRFCCSIGLMMVSAVTSFSLMRSSTGMAICSMCLPICTLSFFQLLSLLPQNLHGSSCGQTQQLEEAQCAYGQAHGTDRHAGA